MTPSNVDWLKATMIAATMGGLFWGLAAGMVLSTRGATSTLVGIAAGAAVVTVSAAWWAGQCDVIGARSWAVGLALAPLTGAIPVTIVAIPALVF